jgi:hypothetical protein
MFILKPDSGRKDSKTGKNVLTVRSGQNLPLFSVIIGLSPLPLLKFALLLSLIYRLMVACLNDRMVNTRNGRTGAESAQGNRTHLNRQVWLKRSPRSSSPGTSRLSCYVSSWPTLLIVAMGPGILPLPLGPPMATLWPLTHRSSPRQESLSRLITGFG